MRNLEQIFDELEDDGMVCFEGQLPGDGEFDEVFRENDEIEYGDVSKAEIAWLFSDSIGQALAVQW